MALADRLSVMSRQCRAGQIITGLEPDDRQAVEDYITAIRDARVTNPWSAVASASKLREALLAEGHRVCADLLRDHLAGRCCCGKTS